MLDPTKRVEFKKEVSINMKPAVLGTILKLVGAGGAAAALSLGVAATYAQAAPSTPNPSPSTATTAKPDPRSDRGLVARAIFQSEAEVLGITPKELRADLRSGKTVAELAQAKGLSKDQFAQALASDVKPRLETLVDHKQLTQAQADKILDRISKGHIPFWNGVHHKTK